MPLVMLSSATPLLVDSPLLVPNMPRSHTGAMVSLSGQNSRSAEFSAVNLLAKAEMTLYLIKSNNYACANKLYSLSSLGFLLSPFWR